MCDGTYSYPNKGGNPVVQEMVLLVTGNAHPERIYPNAFPYIEARFNIIDVTNEPDREADE